MRKQISLAGILWILILILFFTSCDKNPGVYFVNDVNRILSDTNAIPGMKLVIPSTVTGSWTGLEHQLVITRDSLLRSDDGKTAYYHPARSFTVALEDTLTPGKTSDRDTTPAQLVFVKVQGQLWVQFSTRRKEEYAHEYYLPLTSFMKMETIKPDTIILTMPAPKPVSEWLTANHYSWFTTDELRKDAEFPPIIITAPVKDFPAILASIGKQPAMFAKPDTLVRRRD